MDFPFLDREAIEAAADDLIRRAFGDPPLGPLDLDALLFDYLYEEYGLAFYKDRPLGRDGEHDVLGMTYPLRNEIHVDRRLAESGHRGRYRFTVAHEIGHWVLHRPLFVEALGSDEDVRMITLARDVDTAKDDEKPYRPEEWQANHFAISLLLNETALESAFASRFDEKPLAWRRDDERSEDRQEFETLRAFSRHVALAERPGFPELAYLFQLSAEAVAIALEERGYVVAAESVGRGGRHDTGKAEGA